MVNYKQIKEMIIMKGATPCTESESSEGKDTEETP